MSEAKYFSDNICVGGTRFPNSSDFFKIIITPPAGEDRTRVTLIRYSVPGRCAKYSFEDLSDAYPQVIFRTEQGFSMRQGFNLVTADLNRTKVVEFVRRLTDIGNPSAIGMPAKRALIALLRQLAPGTRTARMLFQKYPNF